MQPSNGRRRWFSEILESGLEHEILDPQEVLSHVTPEVMAHHLPPDVLGRVLQQSLLAGAMTPERIMETLSPEMLAEHIPHEVLWTCVVAAAAKAGLNIKGKGDL